MMIKINDSFRTAEEKNDLYKAGYRYIVKDNYKNLNNIDSLSEMPDTANNIYAFTDKTEAKAFVVTQMWKIWTETLEEIDKKKAEQKAKKEAKIAKKATEAGMTVEEYKTERKRAALVKKMANKIAKLETELTQKKALLKELEG